MTRARGFTLIELLVVALIVAVLAALSMNLFAMHDEDRIEGAVRLLERDMEWARSATLTKPDDPAAIRLNADGSGWIVSRNSTPTTAMTAG
ncbi:MAG: Tfp pilus assembly protein FimT/FimU, partial [Planctomycetota bacterium]